MIANALIRIAARLVASRKLRSSVVLVASSEYILLRRTEGDVDEVHLIRCRLERTPVNSMRLLTKIRHA